MGRSFNFNYTRASTLGTKFIQYSYGISHSQVNKAYSWLLLVHLPRARPMFPNILLNFLKLLNDAQRYVRFEPAPIVLEKLVSFNFQKM